MCMELGGGLDVSRFLCLHRELQQQLPRRTHREQAEALQQAVQRLVRGGAHTQVWRVRNEHHRALHLADEPQHEQQQVDERGVVPATAHGHDSVPQLEQGFHHPRRCVQNLVYKHPERRAWSNPQHAQR